MERFFFFFFFPLLCSSVESTQCPGMENTSHECEEGERADESGATDEIFTSHAALKRSCVSSRCSLTWHRGTCSLPCRPTNAISEREVITRGRGGMFFSPCSLPASLFGNLATFWPAQGCWDRPVWPRGGMPRREQLGFDPLPFHHLCNYAQSRWNISHLCWSSELELRRVSHSFTKPSQGLSSWSSTKLLPYVGLKIWHSVLWCCW